MNTQLILNDYVSFNRLKSGSQMYKSVFKWLVTLIITAILSPVQATPIPGQGTWETTLQARDLNHDGVTDAFYDIDLNVTWLSDANINGRHIWIGAFEWVSALTFGGYNDWRMPKSDTCQFYNCVGSEMGHLWYIALGNAIGLQPQTGGFTNLQLDYYYWSGTETTLNSNGAGGVRNFV